MTGLSVTNALAYLSHPEVTKKNVFVAQVSGLSVTNALAYLIHPEVTKKNFCSSSVCLFSDKLSSLFDPS